MRAYWCANCGPGNFGDALTPAILAAFGVPVVWAPIAEAELVMVGSILSKVPRGWTGTVLGSGIIREGLRRDLSAARVLGVRGPLTRDACDLPADTPLGDPGILAPLLQVDHRWSDHLTGLTIAPHYVDPTMARRYPGASVIDVRRPVPEVLGKILAAECLVTSSLHALIAADALGIRHRWEPHAAVIGGSWKFDDYAAALGDTIKPGVWRLSSRDAMMERTEALVRLVAMLR